MSGRAFPNSWDLFRLKLSQVGRDRRAAARVGRPCHMPFVLIGFERLWDFSFRYCYQFLLFQYQQQQ